MASSRLEGKIPHKKGKHQEERAQLKPQNPTSKEEGEIGQSQLSQKNAKRGRKTDKEHREEATYKDKILGAQAMIEAMMNPRFTRQKYQASKGATNPSRGK